MVSVRFSMKDVGVRNKLFALSPSVELAGLKLCKSGAIVKKRRITRSARNSLKLGRLFSVIGTIPDPEDHIWNVVWKLVSYWH